MTVGPAPFGKRLADATAAHGPVCVGLDPHTPLLEAWGMGLEEFAATFVDAFAGRVSIVKPQVAFFEAHGARGYVLLEWVISALRDAGTLVLADAKRGDIGSTMAAYAQAWLGEGSALQSDAVTVSPYLGFGSLQPALDRAPEHGIFVLSATSNPEARELQSGIRQSIVDEAAAINTVADGLGSVGVVIGATLETAPDLSQLNGPILMPGVGAQGAGPDEVRKLAGGLPGVLPAVSRDILKAGPDIAKLRAAADSFNERFAFLR
ncbi:orotidine-5'-phosphate decarboxylase [Smaragdicoccus niigatensis]|uniref:orotidine-5'-phosphate decarboxylase n=1 Tax=Smaragdicoccus niigatensis TaxID=359359 RepID=UPI000381E05D|nr:orotidine-5'-phosphate decarboxylase [Smaragdicoccus niigatensis]